MEEPNETQPGPADLSLTATFAFPREAVREPSPQLPQRPLMVEVVGGPLDGARGRSEDETLNIGRATHNHLALPIDGTVSTEHARVIREEDHYWLEDLSSRNGTFLGDQAIGNRTLIGPGIRFQVGATHVEFQPIITTSARVGEDATLQLPQSPTGERALAAAAAESFGTSCYYLGVEHLFLGLLAEAPELFVDVDGIEIPELFSKLREYATPRRRLAPSHELAPTPRGRLVLELARRIAMSEKEQFVEPQHLLRAILREARSLPVRILRSLRIDLVSLENALESEQEPEPSPTPTLEKYGRDLTQLAKEGRLSPVIGRADEISLLSQVLLRRGKNNPVLVGEAGVGKTAVAEGLAQHLIAADCPEPLEGRRLIELSLSAMVAGTKFRGEFEERLLKLTQEVAAHPEIILFLDELHTLVGAGSAEGAMDASNILKPALARGEIRCVGATTTAEFRRHIEADPALERRFERVQIEEPSPEDTLAILNGLRGALEAHHEVEIQPEALKAAVELTMRHVPSRRLPDKALDVIDQSCARKRLKRFVKSDENSAESGSKQVTSADVGRTVSDWTGIPLERITGEAAKELLSLESELQELVIGQDHAIQAVTRTVLTARAGLADPNRPLGVFFFAGPTGVGKTWLAKCLARVMFGDEKRLVRIDMSEYMEEHSVAGLIGAPPGYVGHEREGKLVGALRTHPHSVVLFDEVEKAHSRVLDLFLQIFDEGQLSGTDGKTASFKQAVVILTSNLDVKPRVTRSLGFNEEEQVDVTHDPRELLHMWMRPELVNRLDEVVAFHPLDDDGLREIVDHALRTLEATLAERKLRLDLSDEVYEHLVELADASHYGAREIRRVVDRHIRHPLAEELLRQGGDATTIRVRVADGELTFQAVQDEEMTT